MESLEEAYLQEYDDYTYRNVEPIVIEPKVAEEKTNAMSDAIGIGDVSQAITGAISDGIAGVQSDYEEDPAQAVYGTGKGAVQGAVGFPGDMVSIIRGLAEVAQTPEGQSKLDSFLVGLDKSTGLPTAMDVKAFLEDTLGVPKSTAEYAEGLGEIIAPVPAISKAVKKTAQVAKRIKYGKDGKRVTK